MVFYILLEMMNSINLSNNINGWVKVDYRNYNPENIFDYINGAGEVYISYKFNNLYVYYFKKGKNEIVVDLFEMNQSKYAHGLFSHLRGNGEEIYGVGEEAEIFGSYLIFWKGRFFVSISSREKILKANIISFGKEIEKKIKKEKNSSKIINFINELKIDNKKIKFFFDMNMLNYNYYFINEDIFDFKNGTEGIFFPYRGGFALWLLFKDNKSAENGLMALKEKFYGGDFEMKEIEKDKWSGFVLKNQLLKIFLDLKSKDNLIGAINENR